MTGIRSNKRSYAATDLNKKNIVFEAVHNVDDVYDAYEKDIAQVTFYFESSSAFEFVRQPRMNFGDFVGQIGGIMGLFMGFSLISVVELVYWFTIRLVKNASTNYKASTTSY